MKKRKSEDEIQIDQSIRGIFWIALTVFLIAIILACLFYFYDHTQNKLFFVGASQILGGVASGLLTLIGVLITIHHSQKANKIQLALAVRPEFRIASTDENNLKSITLEEDISSDPFYDDGRGIYFFKTFVIENIGERKAFLSHIIFTSCVDDYAKEISELKDISTQYKCKNQVVIYPKEKILIAVKGEAMGYYNDDCINILKIYVKDILNNYIDFNLQFKARKIRSFVDMSGTLKLPRYSVEIISV